VGRAERELAEPWVRALRAEIGAGERVDIEDVLTDLLVANHRASRDGIPAMELQIEVSREIDAGIRAIGKQRYTSLILKEIAQFEADTTDRIAAKRRREQRERAARQRAREREKLLHPPPARVKGPPTRERVLALLAEPARPRDIAVALGLQPEIVSRTLRDLEARWQVERVREFERMDVDQRARWYVRVADEPDF
jgi:hypothetical protein